MQQEILLQLSPKDAADAATINLAVAKELAVHPKKITGYQILKKSIDARKQEIKINLKLNAYVDEPFHEFTLPNFAFPDVRKSPHRTIIIGAGPAGLFAALELIQLGIKPILIERGKNVRERKKRFGGTK